MLSKKWKNLKINPSLWPKYFLREKVNNLIRQFFKSQNFHEVEVPLLASSLPAESYYEIFDTLLFDRNRRAKKAYLTTSPEVFLKKLLVAGIGNCFTITKSFRNMETTSYLHNPEFSILEWYRVDANYFDVMKDTENLTLFIYKNLKNDLKKQKPIIKYQGKIVDLSSPWERISVTEAFKKYARMDLEKNLTASEIQITARKKGYHVHKNNTWEELYNQIYLNEVEIYLGKGKPTIIYNFPSQMGALAKKNPTDPRFAERFELYISGLELGDCYSELTDWQEQEARFKKEMQEIKRLGKTQYPYDADFISALKAGLPKCSGLAMGIDRLIMLFADAPKIQDVLFFPGDELW